MSTRTQILDVSQRLIQARGFSAFSYADVAAEIGIRKASVHHHFASKNDLAIALMQRYRLVFNDALAAISTKHARCAARLTAYKQLFAKVLRDEHRLCMCGMLAADFAALPRSVQAEVRGFFDDNERWLAKTLAEGKRRRELAFRGTAAAQARAILSGLEGAMLVARTYRDIARFHKVADQVISNVALPTNR